jgi:transposase
MPNKPLCMPCRKQLHLVQRAKAQTLKSCPHCSTKNGRQHVYHDYPEAYGETGKRVTAANPKGSQSWCTRCRARRGPWSGPLCKAVK